MREGMMRMIRIGRVLGSGRWRALWAGAAALAAVGAVSAVPPAVASASPQQAQNWTEQAPAKSPPALFGSSMVYDAANGKTALLFGGVTNGGSLVNGTWTWNGTTWSERHPAASPPGRRWPAMAYDAANGTVVLFGGDTSTGAPLGDTWTWNGTTWTEQHPAASPTAREGAMMAYDAATHTVVLFGGAGAAGYLNDTWSWNGTTWTEQQPAASPPARDLGSMAFDAASHTVVLFGGQTSRGYLSDTWTWNGTTWTKHPQAATSPPGREVESMAYDAATGTVLMFGGRGNGNSGDLNDTWTWNGTAWTEQQPAASPPAREAGAMAYDAATGTVVLFGGGDPVRTFDDTWTWG
jgi:hypothetical protein